MEANQALYGGVNVHNFDLHAPTQKGRFLLLHRRTKTIAGGAQLLFWVFFFRNHGVTAAWRLYFYVQCKSRDWEREWRGALAAHVYVCTLVQVEDKHQGENKELP